MQQLINITKDRIEFLDTRYYLHRESGLFFPSVTTILEAYPKSPQFYEWLKEVGKNADEIRDNAGESGGKVHELCDAYDSGVECTVMDAYSKPQYKQIEWACFERYVDFRTRFPQYQMLESEKNYFSFVHKFAGTLDRVFEIDGKRILVDIKTSNSLYNHYWLQMAAYAKSFTENTGLEIDAIGVLWLKAKTRTEGRSKDVVQGNGWQLKTADKPIDYYWSLFEGTYNNWKIEHDGEVPKNLSYKLTHKLSPIK